MDRSVHPGVQSDGLASGAVADKEPVVMDADRTWNFCWRGGVTLAHELGTLV